MPHVEPLSVYSWKDLFYIEFAAVISKKDTVNFIDRYRTRQVYVSPAVSWNVYPRPEAFDSSRYRHSWISYTWNIIDILFSDVVL